MELSLFDFDFTEEVFLEEKIVEQFVILQNMFKNNRNSYFMPLNKLPRDMIAYLDEFEERGWIEKKGKGINIPNEHLSYHTFEEIIEAYAKVVYGTLSKHDVCWYKHVLPAINFGPLPIRYKDKETRDAVINKRYDIIKDVATRLGLDHFLNVPSSRGQKITAFSSKWAKKNVLPLIVELVKPINDYDEMQDFFESHIFFFGRRDWDWGCKTAAYPEFKRLSPSYLETAALCEAEDVDTIKLIFDYVGYGWNSNLKGYTVIYPEGWSMEKYEETLTGEDKRLIEEDQERLKRLHRVA